MAHLVTPMSVVMTLSYTGRTTSGVGLAREAADRGRSISLAQGNNSWSARIGKEYTCVIVTTTVITRAYQLAPNASYTNPTQYSCSTLVVTHNMRSIGLGRTNYYS